MLEKPLLSVQQIIEYLARYYHINIIACTLLPMGADMCAAVYKADADNQLSYFIKLKNGLHHEINIDIVELLYSSGIKKIILPIKTINGKSIQFIDNVSLIVYPFIEGLDGFSCELTSDQWKILGATLREIHEIDVPIPLQRQLRQETYSSKWREIVRSLDQQIKAALVDDEITVQLITFILKNRAIIHALVERAEELAQKIKNNSPHFVLCHSDIHAGNVLISANGIIYLVDWDEAMMAPKERDLMFIGGGVGNVWNQSYQSEFFYQGYGKIDINKTLLAYYRYERIVEDIALFTQKLLLISSQDNDRREMYQHFIDMFKPNGVIDIAFKTMGPNLAN
jgi:spectinomycin phosphotransferase